MSAVPLLCPCCSSPPHRYERPGWATLRRTSEARGVQVWLRSGCLHAVGVGPHGIVENDAREAHDEAWNVEALRLFGVQTAHWSQEQRAAFWQRLGYPGACPVGEATS